MDGDRERLVLTERERERESVQKKRRRERETGEMGGERAQQSRSWPPSSSAERSSALGEEERVGTLLRPLSGHTVRLEAGLCDGR